MRPTPSASNFCIRIIDALTSEPMRQSSRKRCTPSASRWSLNVTRLSGVGGCSQKYTTTKVFGTGLRGMASRAATYKRYSG